VPSIRLATPVLAVRMVARALDAGARARWVAGSTGRTVHGRKHRP
jgi:hypothetical protein